MNNTDTNKIDTDTYRRWHSLTGEQKMTKLEISSALLHLAPNISLDYRLEAQSRFPLLYSVIGHIIPENGFSEEEIREYTTEIVKLCLLPTATLDVTDDTDLQKSFLFDLTERRHDFWGTLHYKLADNCPEYKETAAW